MKKPLIFILLIIAGQSFAQRFYLRPKVEYRSYHSSTNLWMPYRFQLFNFEYSTKFIQNEFIQSNIALIKFNPIYNIGLNVGVELKNDNRIEFGWNQDATGSNFNFSDKRDINTIHSSRYSTTIFHHRFDLLYYKLLSPENHLNKNLHFSRTYLALGGGIKFQNVPKKNDYTQEDYLLFSRSFSDEADRIDADHILYGINRFSTFISAGLATSLYFRKKYLFSLNMAYQQGHFVLEATKHTLRVFENNTQIKEYIFDTYSRGSGFVFQISRTFQIHPRKKNGKNPKKNIE